MRVKVYLYMCQFLSDFHEQRPRPEFARQIFKHATILQRSRSPNSKQNHQILCIIYWNIAGRVVTTIITTIIIIMLITISIDQIATSIILAQVKPFFSSHTFPIIFISTIVNYSSTLQSRMSKFLSLLDIVLTCSHVLHDVLTLCACMLYMLSCLARFTCVSAWRACLLYELGVLTCLACSIKWHAWCAS